MLDIKELWKGNFYHQREIKGKWLESFVKNE